MRIGICDDEETSFAFLKGLMQEVLRELEADVEIIYFSSGKELLEQADKLSVVFLDIYMTEMDGIETGYRLKRINSGCQVIIATEAEELYKEGFKIGAYRFMTKPFQKEELWEVIESLMQDGFIARNLTVYQKRVRHCISINEIYYVRSMNDAVELVCETGVYRKKGTLNEMEALLSSTFYRISKGNIINMKKIAKYQNGMVTICDKELKVAVRRKTMFEQEFSNYMMLESKAPI
ncbi:MAG: LytTR family DNA-binding domain-containing protein [Lachnospiraceae bacterium]|nr:LytTR family DNA-binding domain-containing protein [Lachnospiraceae bacterium]